ncbi:Myxococcus xanthus paralogous family TIGR02268 [Stigmatella erecta]|uniref:Myxococcus xanthus paralogous family TIGR02268 n=2 Tax=Stigmatella erecta TaxID=83460 RepID=A0A1I0DWY3_9BACT|nr:Myxococcus xanthus paralogous family TIGR02268 [Stigmatella erecta]
MLFWGTAARAEAVPGERVERTRAVTVTGNPAHPLPALRVAHGTATLILFPAPIQKKTLTFDESRIRVLDAGERSVIVQAVTDLQEGERSELGVFFADGRVPVRAAFVLTTDPVEVDKQIDVRRPEPLSAACPDEAQAREPRPEDFVLLGYMDKEGIPASPFKDAEDAAQGLSSAEGVSYRGKGWGMLAVVITNSPTQPPWTPREATLTGALGLPLRARLVVDAQGAIAPDHKARVLAVVDTPKLLAGAVFTLELSGEDGRRLKIPDVRFPKAGMEGMQ